MLAVRSLLIIGLNEQRSRSPFLRLKLQSREKFDQMLSGRKTFEVYSLGVLLEVLGSKLTVALR